MPFTKSGRYAMNPAYAELLDRAAQSPDNSDADDSQASSDAADENNSDDDANCPQSADASNARASNCKNAAILRIEIEPAEDGGFVTRTHRQQSDSGTDSDFDDDGNARFASGSRRPWSPPYHEPELRAHLNAAHLLHFISKSLS